MGATGAARGEVGLGVAPQGAGGAPWPAGWGGYTWFAPAPALPGDWLGRFAEGFGVAMKLDAIGETGFGRAGAMGPTPGTCAEATGGGGSVAAVAGSPIMVFAKGSGTDGATFGEGGLACGNGAVGPRWGGTVATGAPHAAQKRADAMRAAPHREHTAIPAVSHGESLRVQARGAMLQGSLESSPPVDPIARLSQELAASDSALRALMESLPQPVLILRDGNVTYANPASLALLGAPIEQVLGRAFVEHLDPESRAASEPRLARLLAVAGPQERDELRLVVGGGGVRDVEVTTAPITFDHVPRVLLVLRDETERKRMGAQLLLADRMASMGTLAAGVAHEVNNPLGYAMANVDYALEELRALQTDLQADAGPEETAARLARARAKVASLSEALREARQGADRVRQLVRDLKTFSRADDERQGPLDVRRVLESAINMAYNEVRHRAHLVKDFAPAPLVAANDARLGQVFLNLLVNAAQAMPEGEADVRRIRVTTRADGQGRCVVEIADTGCGIPPENLKRIFDPFFTTKPGIGTGLGLSICQNIMTALGGEISVTSEVGKGTTFRVTLPATNETTPDSPVPTSSALSPTGARARVLVVDDEPMMARAVQRLLGSEHEIVATTDPTVAVELVRSGKRFDVILCDLMMPVLSGMDVYDAVVRLDAAQAQRMIFMTGGAFTTRSAGFLEVVPNQRLEKPLDRTALRAAIRATMA